MATWNDVYREVLSRKTATGAPDLDGVRRDKLGALSTLTGRPTMIYAADFLNQGKVDLASVSLDYSDKEGFVEATQGLSGGSLDVVLHSPGGMAEAVESIVAILRSRFDDIRYIIPNIAKSAATMLALSGDRILMNEASELGPIDPQFTFRRGDGSSVSAPAQAIIDQFELAEARLAKDPSLLAAWLPILQQYGPSLYRQARNAIDLSRSYVEEWLARYMFSGDADAKGKARAIAAYLSDHNNFKSHAKRVGLDEITSTAELRPLRVIDLRKDAKLNDLVWDVYHAVSLTFGMSGTYKLFESTAGRTLVRRVQQVVVPLPTPRKGPAQEIPSDPEA